MAISTVPHLLGAVAGRLRPKSVAVEITAEYAAVQMEENRLSLERLSAELAESAVRSRLIATSELVDGPGAYRAALERENARSCERVRQEMDLIALRRRRIAHARELARALEDLDGVA